jgi:hypothetical protein
VARAWVRFSSIRVPELTWNVRIKLNHGVQLHVRLLVLYPPPDSAVAGAAYRRNGRTHEPAIQLDPIDRDGRMLDSSARICAEFYFCSEQAR